MNDFNKVQVETLNILFNRLKIKDISYCILRNFERIPEDIGNDIDFLVNEIDIDSMSRIINDTMKEKNFKLLSKKSRFGYTGLYFLHINTNNIILLDLFSKSSKKWFNYADVDYILKTKIEYKNFYVPTQGSILYTVLLKDLLTYGKLRSKNNDLLDKLDEAVKKEFIETGSKYFTNEILEKLFDMLKKNKKEYKKEYLFANLKTYNNIKNMAKYTYYRVKEIIENLLFNKMYFIAIIGPDGVGKSTVTTNLKNDLKDKGLFKDSLDIHHRFEFIPNISEIFKKKNPSEETEKNNNFVVINPTSTHTWYRTLIYVIYYSIDFILGYIHILKFKSKGGIVIADRYYYDFYIQKHYDKLPNIIKRIFYALIPHPNIILFLSADAEVIYKRKYELTLEETINQNNRCENIVNYHNGIVIDADNDAQNVNNQIKNVIYKRMIDE